MALRRTPIPTRHSGELELIVFDNGSIRFKSPSGLYASGDRIEIDHHDDWSSVNLWSFDGISTSIIVDTWVSRRIDMEVNRSF